MFSLTRSVVRAAFSSSRGEGLIPLGAALLAPGAAVWEIGGYLANRAANALAALRRTLGGMLHSAAESLVPTEEAPAYDAEGAEQRAWEMGYEAGREEVAQRAAWDAQDDATALSEFHADAYRDFVADAPLTPEPAIATPRIAQDATEAPDDRDIVQAVSLAVAVQRCGSVRGAARALGMAESTLRRRLKTGAA